MDRKSLLAVALAVLVGLYGATGAAMADSSVDVHLADAAASSGDSVTKTLTYTFTASSNQSVTANDVATYDGGTVAFEFTRWDDLDTGQGGTGTSWNLVAGHEYRVTFETTVYASAASQSYSSQVFDSGPYAFVEVNVLAPQFGALYTQETDLVFESEEKATVKKKVEISNTGDGLMRPTEVTFNDVPSGFTVDYTGLPDEIAAGQTGKVNLKISADPSVQQGTYEFDATAHDNLGNSETFTVRVTVEKPPVFGIEGGGSEVNIGDVLVGSEKSMDFVVREQGGYSGIDGVTSKVLGTDQFGSISFEGLTYLSTDPGGTDTAEVTVSVKQSASQHDTLQWTVFLKPDEENGVGKRVTFTGRAIYPAKYGTLSMSDTSMVFDEPKSQVNTHTKTVTVTVPNTGDKNMNLQDVSAQIDDSRVSATVVDYDSTIGGLSSGQVTVKVEADPETPEGSYSLNVVLDAEKAGRKTISKDVQVSHEVALSVEKTSLSYGDVIVTKNLTQSTDIAEALEYQDVTDLSITRVSGPDKWLTVVERPPATLTAGDAAPFVVALRFDTSAKLYREYTWEYRVTGEGIEPQTITVTATPKPYSFDQIRDPLNEFTGTGDWRGETASGMVATLDALEKKLKGGSEVSRTDLTTSIAAGRSTLLFIDSVQTARETRASEGNEAAQEDVIRAAATYNLLDSYVSKLDDPELQSSAEQSRKAAKETVDQLIGQQRSYYQSQLESENVSKIEQAHIKRQLAQLAALQGEKKRAEQLRTESAEAFDRYTELVKQGNQKRQTAREYREEMRESMLTVVFDQPLVLNPANWDAFEQRSSAVLSTYDEAATSFEKAGAETEATRVRDERQEATSAFQIARYSLYGSTAVYAVLFLGLVGYLVRNTYAYVRDAREAVTGDFLVAS